MQCRMFCLVSGVHICAVLQKYPNNFQVPINRRSFNSASSSTRSGREAAATHWKNWCAHSQFCWPISSNIRSYVSSSVSGNSSRARRMRCRRQCRRYSSWQNAHRNLHHRRKRVLRWTGKSLSYIPSAFLVSTSMTSSLSALLHARILGSELTTNLMYSVISWACPFSSCRETERNANEVRTDSMSASGRLVTQSRRVGICNSTRSFTSFKTSSRGDGQTSHRWAFVQGINDDVDCRLLLKFKDLLEMLK